MRTRTALTMSFGIGSISALATYIFANPDLRKEMIEAKNATDAAAALGHHLKKDALETTDQTLKMMHRHQLMRSLEQRFARAAAHAKRELTVMKHEARSATRTVKHHAKKAAHHAKKAVSSAAKETTAAV